MRAHRTDLVSLAFGLLFVGLAAWWLIARLLGFVLPPVGWFLAGALLLVGVLGLVGALRAARSPRPAAADGPAATDGTTGPAGTVGPTSGHPVPEVAAWETGRADDTDGWPVPDQYDRDVSAPLSGAPATGNAGREEADEWPTEAVTDRRDEAVEDRSADVPEGWPPTPPAGGDRR